MEWAVSTETHGSGCKKLVELPGRRSAELEELETDSCPLLFGLLHLSHDLRLDRKDFGIPRKSELDFRIGTDFDRIVDSNQHPALGKIQRLANEPPRFCRDDDLKLGENSNILARRHIEKRRDSRSRRLGKIGPIENGVGPHFHRGDRRRRRAKDAGEKDRGIAAGAARFSNRLKNAGERGRQHRHPDEDQLIRSGRHQPDHVVRRRVFFHYQPFPNEQRLEGFTEIFRDIEQENPFGAHRWFDSKPESARTLGRRGSAFPAAAQEKRGRFSPRYSFDRGLREFRGRRVIFPSMKKRNRIRFALQAVSSFSLLRMPSARAAASFIFVIAIASSTISSALAGGEAALLRGQMLGPTPLMSDLRELSDGIGGRPTGSPALQKAVDWAVKKFREVGVDDARTDAYTAAGAWLPGFESAEVAAGPAGSWGSEKLRTASMPFSHSTGEAGLEAPVVDIGHGAETDFASLGEKGAGKWLLLHTEPMKSLEDLFKEYLETPPIFERAQKSRAAGILWMSNRTGRVLYRHNVTLDGSPSPLPAAIIEREGALRIARRLASGSEVRVRLISTGTILPNVSARNVVAEIRGREKPDEIVIIGAHLDSWELGRGAEDNGCNAALVIDVARQIAALARDGKRPRRTIRFSLYTGEECGLFGSLAEVRAHRSELDRIKAQIIFDIGSGRTTGFSLGGRADLEAATERALADVAALGPFSQTTDAFVGTDNYDYLVEGIPTLVANQDGPPYLPEYHAESDTIDKVDERELKLNSAIAAVLSWNFADGENTPAPRQNRKEIEELVQKTRLADQMKIFGLWDSFAKGERGRAIPEEPKKPKKR